MTNRREFLRTGVSVSALPLANGFVSSSASASIEGDHIVIYKALFDDRYAECRTFAKIIGGWGVPVHALHNGDITDLWRGELDAVWRKRPAAIVGSTQFGPMFVFEQLGRERNMRVRLRVEHQARDDGTIVHVMTGQPDTLALAEHLRLQGADWPVLMAALLTHCGADAVTPVERSIVMPGANPVLRQASISSGVPSPESVIHYYTPQAIREGHGVPWDGPLFSWVIAPAARGTRGLESPHP